MFSSIDRSGARRVLRPANGLDENGFNGLVFNLDCFGMGVNGVSYLMDWGGLDDE